MSLRLKFTLYLVFLHLVTAAVAVPLLLEDRVWLLLLEVLLLCSLVVGFRLVSAVFRPLDLIREGTEFLNEQDFTARFVEVGHPETDDMIRVYNRMIDTLRGERVRNQERQFFLDRIVSASPSGIITLDFDGGISLVNAAAERLLQVPVPAVVGTRLEAAETPFGAALARLAIGESTVVPLSGGRRVKCTKSQFLDRGFPRQFVLLEELTEELRRSEKAAYDKLIRLMSHEVNNSIGAANSLLHSCLTYAEQLRDEDREDFEAAINVVISRTDQLNLFMRAFADVARLPEPRLQPCDLRGLLEGVGRLLQAEFERRRIRLRWEVDAPLPPISMDRLQMEQAFLNVVKNALEAIGEDGTVTIRTGRSGARPWVAVEDTGSGIGPEARLGIFTPFFTTKDDGQGIGLTLVQEILRQHSFDFALESAPGQPTRFTIHF